MLAPIADKLGIDLVWFGVLVGINLQTSFLTPPFGFALFYLRSVAPTASSVDAITGRTIPGIKTSDIYLGVLPFVAIQVLVMGLVIGFPSWIIQADAAPKTMDVQAIDKALDKMSEDVADDDPMKMMLEQMARDQAEP
jgi:TRAP-type mannitol/chloroaromatic compound transport system permease large subunit